jgi:predicted secreted Zn-dependent protease
MKRSELKSRIEEVITELLGEAGTYAGAKAVDDMKKDPDYNTLNGQAKIDAEKKLKTGGSVTVGEGKKRK